MSTSSQRQRKTLPERQARVGIVANPKHVAMPVHEQQDVWGRGPDLRSSRRPSRQDPARDPKLPPVDPVISGEALRLFAQELRGAHLQGDSDPPAGLSLRERLAGRLTLRRSRLILWLALGVLFSVVALLALPLLILGD